MMASNRVYGRFFTRRLPGLQLLQLILLGSAFVVGAVEGQITVSEVPQTTLNANFSSASAASTTLIPPSESSSPLSDSSSPNLSSSSSSPSSSSLGSETTTPSSFSSSSAPETSLADSSVTSSAAPPLSDSSSAASSSASPSVETSTEGSSSSSSGASSTTAGQTDTSSADSSLSSASTTIAPAEDKSGKSLYEQCGKNGTVCYGDKGNCIKTASCTFLGAIKENDNFINVTLLTRVYNPPYDGVNLTVELSRDKKGNDSVFRCGKPRFKTFKILLSWKNKTNYEPGNETQTAQTVIDKNQLIKDCLADQETNNFTIPPSQTLALKFYIENSNNDTLVSQGLTHIAVQDSTPKPSLREGKALDFGDTTTTTTTTESPVVAKENMLYELCLKNYAKCFGDRAGCTEQHNCTILGVIKEERDNYHVYLVTKSYDPPLDYINLTLTLNAPLDNSSTTTPSPVSQINANISSILNMTDLQVDCGKQEFTDLSLQSVWKTNSNASTTLSPSLTNASTILETTVDKMKLQNRCETNVKNLKGNMTSLGNGTDETSPGIIEDDVHVYVKFHLENGTLSPSEVSDDFIGGLGDSISITNENGTFEIGQNGTAYLVIENTAPVVMAPEEDGDASNSINDSVGRSLVKNGGQTIFFSYLLFLLSASLVLYSNSRTLF